MIVHYPGMLGPVFSLGLALSPERGGLGSVGHGLDSLGLVLSTCRFRLMVLNGKAKASKKFITPKRKGSVYLLMELHLTATECHLPYRITQCYLPPDTSEHAPP